jgi:hypothetical protein
MGPPNGFLQKVFIIFQKEIENNLEKLSFFTIKFIFQIKSCKFCDQNFEKGKIGFIMQWHSKSMLY